MDYAALKTELALPAYLGKTDAEILALLNDPTIEYFVTVPTADVHNFLVNAGLMVKLLTAYHYHAVPEIKIASEMAIDAVMGQIPEIDLGGNSAIQRMLPAMVAASVFTQPEADSIVNLARRTRSRADQLGLGAVTQDDLDYLPFYEKSQQIEELQRQFAAGANRVSGDLALRQEQLLQGQDVDVPEWSACVALFNEAS